jgi:signal transduction histidine kinase
VNVAEIKIARDRLDGYIRYTRLYTDSLRTNETNPFSALGQIEWVVESFGDIAKSRGIGTVIDCDEDLLTPKIPVAMYSAILLNLYTNATKAVIARTTDELDPLIRISAWNDPRYHNLSVEDTGVGIPVQFRRRIWDPFFTTTSRVNSPLGTGMGLGLSLVKDLVMRVGGRAEVVEADSPYSTCILISIPRNINEK